MELPDCSISDQIRESLDAAQMQAFHEEIGAAIELLEKLGGAQSWREWWRTAYEWIYVENNNRVPEQFKIITAARKKVFAALKAEAAPDEYAAFIARVIGQYESEMAKQVSLVQATAAAHRAELIALQ